jgi:protein TonB
MEIKKYPGADIKRRTDIYFMIGLTASLAFSLALFSFTNHDEVSNVNLAPPPAEEVEEVTDITRQDQAPPPPPPPPQTIEVIENESEIEEQTIQSSEVTQDTEIKTVVQEQVVVEEKTAEPEIFTVVEENPEFPGGVAKMYEFIGKNLNYPPLAKENNIQGRVVIQFVVNEDGSITDVKILKDIGWGCGDEATKVVKSMPRWKPGKQRNKAVKVRYNLPIKFELN